MEVRMTNKIELGRENLQKFETWIAERKSQNDYLDYIRAGKLNRSEVAKELGFGRSVFAQNLSIKELALQLDAEWGVEKPTIPKTERELTEARERANDKVKRTEASNSKLLEKIAMLEAEVRQLKLQNMELGQFKTAKSAFLETVERLK